MKPEENVNDAIGNGPMAVRGWRCNPTGICGEKVVPPWQAVLLMEWG